MNVSWMRSVGAGAVLLLPGQLWSQASVTLAAAVEGRRVIEQMVVAVGGREALRSIRTIISDETIQRSSRGQGLNPHAPGVVQGRRTVWFDVSGQRINELRILDITGNQLWDVQRFITRNAGTVVSWSSMTKDSIPAASLPSQRAAFARRNLLPFLLSIERRPDAARSLGTTMVKGRPQDVVAITDVDGVQLTLMVDRQTHLPTRIEQLVITAALGDTVDVLTFSDYRKVGGLLLPHRRDELRSNDSEWVYRVERLELDAPIADTMFAVPAGLTQANAPVTSMVKLAPDVYLVPGGGYQSLFVVFDEYVVVLEGGGAGQGRNTIARIREVAPGKPIRYVVATHFHEDHIAGLRPFIAEGTTIVTTADAKERIEALARARSRLAPDTLDRAPRAPIIEVVEKQRTFKDGHHEVQLHQIGPNAHVDQILIGYLPAERILFEGDLLDFNGGQPAAGGDDTADFARKVRALGLTFDRLIPVHGEPGTAADLEKSLRRGFARAKCPTGAARRTPCLLDGN